MATILVVVGTRPEATKLAPVVRALRAAPGLTPVLVSTGQHTDLLTSALGAFGLTPDHDLKVMTAGQTPAAVAARVLERFPAVLDRERPAAVLVQGDTTTALAAGLTAFYAGVPVGHVEAGLRTGDLADPFPEEANRQLLGRLARWHFAPTEGAAANLRAEGVPVGRVRVVGNTAVDAVLAVVADSGQWTVDREDPDAALANPCPLTAVRYLLVTLHRRESFGEPLRDILAGLVDFLAATPDATAVWPVHPNPAVTAAAAEFAHPRLTLVPPQGFAEFVRLMAGSRLILTDSGGVQEEAPSLGVRVLVARDTTERPEAVAAGLNRLIGRSRERVAAELARGWSEPAYDGPRPAPNPYGDGTAAERIVASLNAELGMRNAE